MSIPCHRAAFHLGRPTQNLYSNPFDSRTLPVDATYFYPSISSSALLRTSCHRILATPFAMCLHRQHRFLTTCHASRISSKLSAPKTVDKDVQQYWDKILSGIEKTTAKKLIQFIDTSCPLGISTDFDTSAAAGTRGVTSSGSKLVRPPAFSFFLETKLQHPTKVILCRVGEFYETVGIDAILLVQHAGLNPMGKEGNPPRAGCPRVNLRRTVQDLVDAGLSVVVCEEVPEKYQYGVRKQPKKRYIAAVVTPAAPHFLHGLIDEDSDLILDAAPPLLGIAAETGGFTIIEVNAELRTVRKTEGLTEDAVYARLYEGGLAPPLYLHVPPVGAGADRRLTEAIPESEWEQRVRSVFRTEIGAIHRYDDPDPVHGMVERVKRQLSLDANTHFTHLPSASPKNRPRPLYFSTASNLGLHKTRGIPSLLDCALLEGSPLTARRWLRSVLLLPPPPHVGMAIHQVCRALQFTMDPVPSFPVMTPANVVLKLRSKEANDTFFRELGDLCRTVKHACSNDQFERLAGALLTVVAAETGSSSLDRHELARACDDALQQIHDVIDHETVLTTGKNASSFEGESGSSDDEEDGVGNGYGRDNGEVGFGGQESGNKGMTTSFNTATNISSTTTSSTSLQIVLQRMFDATEDYRGKIRPARLSEWMDQVEEARTRVEQEARRAQALAYSILGTTASSTSPMGQGEEKEDLGSSQVKLAFVYDVANNAVWLKVAKASLSSKAAASGLPSRTRIQQLSKPGSGLIHPRDRNGKTETGVYSTPELEQALDDYRRACSEARDAVRNELRALAERLLSTVASQLVSAATFAVVASALDSHVREAARRGWSLPVLEYETTLSSSSSTVKSCKPFSVRGMWPYWLGSTGGIDVASDIVKNSFDMNGMFLLTGPNMAGKSTILRSTCAVALLGACGLAVPAHSSTSIPYFDAFMLRNFSADSPLQGQSSFAVEMTEMRYVLADATSQSLVLVDELGKGTEAKAGAALAASMLEKFDKIKCKGIFATHLHSILEMDLNLPNTERKRMEVSQRKPTKKMVSGESTESLALQVAAECRLPNEIVERAAALYHAIMMKEASSPPQELHEHQEMTAMMNDVSARSRTLDEAAAVLEFTASSVLSAIHTPKSTAEDNSGTNTNPHVHVEIQSHHVPPTMFPPPRTMGASCVYIARRTDGWFYVGSTDSLLDRIRTHRRTSGDSKVRDPNAEFVYVLVNNNNGDNTKNNNDNLLEGGGASAAKTVEAQVIRAMHRQGFPLLSDADARKKSVPMPPP